MTEQQTPSFEQLQNWVVPGATTKENKGLIIGGNPETNKWAIVSFSQDLTRALGVFKTREHAERTVELINAVLNAPAASRVGGTEARSGLNSKHPGVEWVGLGVTQDESGHSVPDTSSPLARMWVLPHREYETIALMDVDGPDGHTALCGFIDDDAANQFIATVDAMFEYVSHRVKIDREKRES